MAARSIASTTISFGLVSVPVKLYSTGESSGRVSFNYLHEKCGTRLKQQYYCPKDEEIVPREDIVKGYEFAKGQYVIFTEEELEALETPKGDSIEIVEFVPEETVDRVYFDRGYYLGPDKGGARPYRLFAAALNETGRVAIGKYASRGKQVLVMIRAAEDLLLMDQLRYANEVRPASEVPVESGEVKAQELKLATQLIEQLAADEFHPEAYRDEARERTLEMIQKKVEGEEIAVQPDEEGDVQIIDLMEALRASLDEGGGRKPPQKAGRKGSGASRKAAGGESGATASKGKGAGGGGAKATGKGSAPATSAKSAGAKSSGRRKASSG